MHANSSISQKIRIPKTQQFEEAFIPGVAATSGVTCRYCDAPATDNVTPPLCERHLDVVVLICTLQERDLPVNAEYARHLLETAITNGGHWTITPDELDDLFVSTLRQVRRTQRENKGGEK